MPGEIRAIQDQQHGVRLWDPLHVACENVASDSLVFGTGSKAVNSRKVDQECFAAIWQWEFAEVVLDCNAWEIRDLLAQTSQTIEKSGFTRVGRAYESHDM